MLDDGQRVSRRAALSDNLEARFLQREACPRPVKGDLIDQSYGFALDHRCKWGGDFKTADANTLIVQPSGKNGKWQSFLC